MLFKEDKLARLDAETIRRSVGWYRWTHDLVEITGAGALEILEKIYVSNISKVLPGKTKYTAMLDEKGEIIDDVIVMHMDEGVYWVSTLYGPRLIPWIEAHAEGKDVKARLITYDWDMYAVQGPEAPAALEKLLDTPLESMKRFSVAAGSVNGIPVYVHRSGFTGENGFEIYCAADRTAEVRESIAKAVEAAGGREIYTLEVYVRSIPMEKGFALKQDFKHLNPFECGLGWSVDLNKDFIGKEATLAIRENPRYQMVGLVFDWESTEDISIWERVYLYGVEVGRCAQAIYGYTVDKNIGFATIRAGIPEGTRVTVGPNGSPATVVSKVFC
ncbi:MAG: aminomethyltransferase family protein [Oscillospiraceae bacterium]|nr:aminomethyltransferase family protein [Oscillospiraceae bacterium]